MRTGWNSVFIQSSTNLSQLKTQIYKTGYLLPVLKARHLLNKKQFKVYLDHLKSLSDVSDAVFDNYYVDFINRFAEFVQILPSHMEGSLCGLLNEGLVRGINCLNHFVKTEGNPSKLDRYAMFTAAVLQDVALVAMRFKILTTNKEGEAQHTWEPLRGTICDIHQAQYYRLFNIVNNSEFLKRNLTLLFARQIIPEKAFEWLSSDAEVFSAWLCALLDDEDGEGSRRFKNILSLYKNEEIEALFTDFIEFDFEQLESISTSEAEYFFHWLRDKIDAGEISVNGPDSHIQVMGEGVFVELPAILKTFKELHLDGDVDLHTLMVAIANYIGAASKGGHDYSHKKLYGMQTINRTHQGAKLGFTSSTHGRSNPEAKGIVVPGDFKSVVTGKKNYNTSTHAKMAAKKTAVSSFMMSPSPKMGR